MYEDLLGKKDKLEDLIVEEVKAYYDTVNKATKKYSKFIFKVLNPNSGLTNGEAQDRTNRILKEMGKYEANIK